MPNLFYLPITTEEERQFAMSLAKECGNKDRNANWNRAKNLVITDCKQRFLDSLPGDFKEISKCNPKYKVNLCDLSSMKKEALKIFILGK